MKRRAQPKWPTRSEVSFDATLREEGSFSDAAIVSSGKP
jgi:hypothetical protein